VSSPARPLCSLHFATGEHEACTGEQCGFWEEEGCPFDAISFELDGRPGVASWLLGIRRALESARTPEEVSGARASLRAFLPPGLRD
jgi:hypothetical protein